MAPDPVPARLVEPRADELVRKMSDLLVASKAFALEAEEVYDEVPEDLPRIQLTSRRHVALRRPDRVAGTAAGDAINRSVWYDGKTVSVLDDAQNVYVRMDVPPTSTGPWTRPSDRTGMVIPLADFLYSDVYDRLMGSVERGVYLGIHDVGGIPCHHLAFEQATIDWQLWIDAGPQPLPRKLVIAYKTEDEVPQYEVTIRKWNLAADVPDALFEFQPPPGAREGGAAGGLRRRCGRSGTARRGHTAAGDAGREAASQAGEEAMKRQATAVLASMFVVLGQTAPLLAGGRGGGGGARVGFRGVARGIRRQRLVAEPNGNVSGSRSVTQTSSGYNVNRQASTASGASHEVNKDVNTSGGQVQSVNRTSTATNASGQSANRDRTTTNEGGYASVQGNASTSTGREASGQGAVGKNAYGQTVATGSVNTKYNGSYAGAAKQNPNGTWNTATAGPNGVKVTQTLPSGYKTTTYAGTPYYASAGVYYRPYTYYGVPYYYPVPPPYYYQSTYVPVGAIVVTVAAATYMMSEGSYYQQTTSSQGQVVYQTVPAPQGASLKTLPVERVLVTRRRHDLLPVRQHVLPARRPGWPGELRGGHGPGRRRDGRGPARELRGDAAQHAVFRGRRGVLRSLPGARRQGAVRRRRPAAAAGRSRCAGSGRGACRATAGRRGGVPHRDRVVERAGGHARARAHGVHGQLDERPGRRSLPGLPRPRPRGLRPARRRARQPRLRPGRERRQGRQDEGPARRSASRSPTSKSAATSSRSRPSRSWRRARRGRAPRRCSAAPRSAPGSARSPTAARGRRSGPGSVSRRVASATAASSQDAANLAAQSVQSFTVSVPFEVQTATQVAVN